MGYWLAKSDPDAYSWEDLKNDKKTDWDGVRNYQARNYLNEMQKGDLVLIYHSGKEKQVLGVCTVERTAYQDPTTDDDRWVAVEFKYKQNLKHPVSLQQIRKEKSLEKIPLLKQTRLSVMPVTEKEYDTIINLSENGPIE